MKPLTRHPRNDLFLRAAMGERTERTPVWLMRQAGRTDPEYRKIRTEAALPLEELFRHPELAARISLSPKRLGVDALILFQDILTPLAPMGAPFAFAPGPMLDQPLRNAGQVSALRLYDVADELPFVPETFRLILEALDGELPVLGFAGAPLTSACFLIEGKSLEKGAGNAQQLLSEQPQVVHQLLDKLTIMTIDYLTMQIEAGAAAIQLFESAAHLFTAHTYKQFALPYQQRVFEALKGMVPTILFARNREDMLVLDAAGADILSLPSSISIADARRQLGAHRVFQGNLDNRLLAYGTLDEITRAARACLASGQRRGHIFNLNHGLLPETPHEHVVHLIKTIKSPKE